MWLPLALSLASGVAQAIPTADEIDNNKKIKELEARKAQGKLGLTDQQRGTMWSETSGAANARIAEERQRGDATLAATGNTSGGAIAGQQAAQMSAAAQAATSAADQINKADQTEHDASLQELSDRIAVKGSKAQERKNEVLQNVGKVGDVVGTYEGTTGTSVFNDKAPSMFDGWKKTNYEGMDATKRGIVEAAETLWQSGQKGDAERLLKHAGLWTGE